MTQRSAAHDEINRPAWSKPSDQAPGDADSAAQPARLRNPVFPRIPERGPRNLVCHPAIAGPEAITPRERKRDCLGSAEVVRNLRLALLLTFFLLAECLRGPVGHPRAPAARVAAAARDHAVDRHALSPRARGRGRRARVDPQGDDAAAGVLQRACEWDRLASNPAPAVRKPSAARARAVEPLTPDAVEAFVRSAAVGPTI